MSRLRTVATLGALHVDGLTLTPVAVHQGQTTYVATDASGRYQGAINKSGRFYEAVPMGSHRHELETSMADAVRHLQKVTA